MTSHLSQQRIVPTASCQGAAEEPGHASNDEHEVGNAANKHHHRIGPAHMARTQKDPKLSSTGLHEMRHEQIEAVPQCRDDDPNAKSPKHYFGE
jgi:hypothetical protein